MYVFSFQRGDNIHSLVAIDLYFWSNNTDQTTFLEGKKSITPTFVHYFMNINTERAYPYQNVA